MKWIYLMIAILAEVIATTSIKYSEGFTLARANLQFVRYKVNKYLPAAHTNYRSNLFARFDEKSAEARGRNYG